jgi:hypothetical protein
MVKMNHQATKREDKMKYPKLSNASSVYGASMGRSNNINEPDAEIKFHLYAMPMFGSCYDSGGAYWGCGSYATGRMYHAYGDGPEFQNEMFIRAKSREDAKRQVRDTFKNAKFFR